MADKNVPAAKAVVDSSIRLFRAYVEGVNKLPKGDDYDYHSVFPGFVETMNSHKERLDKIVNVFANAAVSPQRQRKLLSTESKNRVLDVVDMMFENIDTLLDEVSGAKMDAEAQNAAFNSNSVMDADDADDDNASSLEAKRHSRSFVAAPHGGSGSSATTVARKAPAVAVARPQLQFTRAVDNSAEPFKPLLFSQDTHELTYGVAGLHPHQKAIETFSYTTDQLRYREELLPAPLAPSNLHFVTSIADLDAMIDDHLAKSKEIAVDLEHHELHSYQGITSLMQISTRNEDFLVDVFPLRDHLHRLNKVFLDPSIVKVLHGCKEDIRWLQKDFGCYIVNLFDTGVALQTLHMPYSLAFAVDHYCQVKLNKQYQRADWRVRPLPSDMVHYARQDTHYLLYIYDRLSNQLLQQEGGRAAVLGNLLVHVLNESRQLCLLKYEKPAFDEKVSFRDGLGKAMLGLSATQSERARVIYNWRESVARIEDESPSAVMHASSVVQLATNPAYNKNNIPTATQLLRGIHPLSMAVRSQIKSLVDVLTPTYADEEEKVHHHHSHHKTSATTAANGVTELHAQRARRQLRHYPLTGTMPCIVARNTNAAGAVFELDVGNSAAGTLEGTVAAVGSSTSSSSSPSSPFAAILAAQQMVIAAAAAVYKSVLPPASQCLERKVVTSKGITMEPTTDSLGIVRPGARETLLMKAIREEKAHAAIGGGAAASNDDALPDQIDLIPHNEEDAVTNTTEGSAAAKRPREEDAEEEKAAEGTDAPMSLKEQFGLGRQQRKKGGARKE